MAKADFQNGVTLEYEIHRHISNPVIFIILGITDKVLQKGDAFISSHDETN
jgi:hypothetical protein